MATSKDRLAAKHRSNWPARTVLKQTALGTGLVVLASSLLAACGSQARHNAASQPSSAASTSTTSQPSATAAPSSTPGPKTTTTNRPPNETSASTSPTTAETPACSTANLSISETPAGGVAAGTVEVQFAITNESTSSCRLEGYPTVGLVGPSNRPLPTTVSHGPPGPSPVLLQPKQSAYFTLAYPDATGYGDLSCPTSTELLVYLPGQSAPLVVSGSAGRIQAYGGNVEDLDCGSLTVSALSASPPIGN